MKQTLIILSLLFFPLLSSGQSERPETIIIPVSSLGDVPEVRKQILQNTLTDELKKHFRIVPQEKYEQVLEQVFEELEYEECTEDQCIMRVQEMLQVENVFNLQVLGEDKDTQLNLTWRTLDEKKNETDVCLGCGTFQLNDKVRGLVEKLVGEMRVEVVQKKPIVVVEEKKKGVLYWVNRNGEFGWNKSGDEKKDSKYVGEIRNGNPNGQGILIDSNLGYKYEGEWRDGQKTGHGIETQREYYSYEGRFKNGEHHGQGTFISFRNGKSKYIGEFRNNLPWNLNNYKDGKLIFIFVNGEKIEQ